MGVPELEQYRQQFEAVKAQTQEVTAGLNEEKFNWRPAPDQWSIEECLSHLTILGQFQVRAIEEAIDRGRANGITGTGPFRCGPIERWFIGSMEPPVRRKFPAPRRLQPLHGQPVTAIVPTFLHLQSQFLAQLDRAQGLDLARVKVVTMISRFLKFSLGATFALAAAHERRHLEQARRVRQQM